MATTALKRRTPSLGATPTITSPPPHSPFISPTLTSTTTTTTTTTAAAAASAAEGSATTSTSSKTPPPPGSSLYHTCRLVLDKLALVDGMSYWLDLEVDNLSPSLSPINSSSPPLMPLSTSSPSLAAVNTDVSSTVAGSSNDPLSKLCYLCRRGTPLFTLFNALNTHQPLKMDPNPKLNQVNNCKASVYHFLVACRKQLLFPEEELFTVSDLYVDDTNGFVKVVNTVLKILQLLEDKGIISSQCANQDSCPVVPPKDIRDQVVLELLSTERKYVQDLETLQTYMRELQQQRILSQDTVHYLFGNLNALVDFQRRFLIQMEKTAENQPQDQHFGLLFSQMEDAFSVYEPYCSNFYSAQDLVVQEAPKLQKLNIMNPTHQLTSLLIKPIQRICKYPLLLNELIKSTNKEWLTVPEMAIGLDTMRRVADKVNETQRKHENLQMVVELKRRVDDWKGISIDKCGQLLLQDKMVVTAYDNEREMHVFFFENRLLLCKENKDNTKNRLTKANTITMKKRRRGTLEPKGKIETSRIVSLQNVSSNGEWALMIEWKESEVEQQFTLKFRNEEQYKLWESTLNKQKDRRAVASSSSLVYSASNIDLHSNDINAVTTASNHSSSGVYYHPDYLSTSPLNQPHVNDNWSFIDPDDEEDEVDSIEDDREESGSGSRSRSNSFSAQILNSFSTRPKFGRNNSTDITGLKPLSTPAATVNSGRSNTPGLNLQPLPRSNNGNVYHYEQSAPGDYFFYPSSPPPSNPSSPTSSSRVSPNNSTSGRAFRDHPSSQMLHHHYLQHHQKQQKSNGGAPTILSTPCEPMTPSMDYFTTPTTDTFESSLLTGRPGPSLSDQQHYDRHHHHCHHHHHHHHHQQRPPPAQSRSRAQSSPSISRRHDNRPDLAGAAGYYPVQQQRQHSLSTTLPKLSPDKKSSLSLHSDMDRLAPSLRKVKIIYNDGVYSIIIVPQDIGYQELMYRVDQKLQVVGDLPSYGGFRQKYRVEDSGFRLKYRDEDGDFITINSDDDIQMAFDYDSDSSSHFYVCM